jgi:hypothetical protein
MADENQVQLDAIPWYKSPQFVAHTTAMISAAIALSPKIVAWVGTHLGIDLSTPAAIQATVETVFGFIALIAPSVGAMLRARSKIQPLVISQKKADVVNAPAAIDPPSTPKI